MLKFFKKQNKTNEEKHLIPDRYPNKDFFIPDIFDGIPFKDDMASMEHPIFSLSTKPDLKMWEYKNKGVSIKIAPSTHGLPTIFDKDVLLYCGSLLMAEINKGFIPPKTLRISTYDLLHTTNRPKGGGESYTRLKQALERLKGVSITTNIKTNKVKQSSGFGLIDKWNIIESCRVKKRMVKLEITVSDWFYQSIVGKEVLKIDPKYFRLRQALERRLYEIARKHCGTNDLFKINMENLYLKSGSKSTLRLFRFSIKKIVEKNVLPEYSMSIENDVVTFKNRKSKVRRALTDNSCAKYYKDSELFLKTETMEKARKMALEAGTGWDIYAIREEFNEFNKNKVKDLKDIDASFIGFVKSKIKRCP